jgi:hypothetical protein
VKIPLSVVFRMLVYAAVAVATIVVTTLSLQAKDTPEAKAPATAVVIACAVVIAVGGVAESVYRLVIETWGSISYDRRLVAEDNLKGLLVSLDEETNIPWTEIGLTAFIVRWRLMHPFGRVQVRVARLRMKTMPRPTSVLWTRKKGVLGRCWRNRRDEDIDHQVRYGAHMNCTKEQWRQLGQDIREHLTYDDFLAIRDFGYVLACPILTDGRYRGCLVIQVLPKYKGELAVGTKARELLHVSADTIAGLLSRP